MARAQSVSYAVDRPPTAAECLALRQAAARTHEQMALLAGRIGRQWWYKLEAGRVGCDLATWELVLLKTGQHPTLRLRPK